MSVATVAGILLAALVALGLGGLVALRNAPKQLLALSILAKAATISFVLAGATLDDMGRAQALAFTAILVDAAVIAVAAALVARPAAEATP